MFIYQQDHYFKARISLRPQTLKSLATMALEILTDAGGKIAPNTGAKATKFFTLAITS